MPDGRVLGSPDAQLAEDRRSSAPAAGNAFTTVDDVRGADPRPRGHRGRHVGGAYDGVAAELLHRGVARAWASSSGCGACCCSPPLFVADRLGRRVSTPVTDLAGVAHRLREGDLDARAEPAGPPETVSWAWR